MSNETHCVIVSYKNNKTGFYNSKTIGSYDLVGDAMLAAIRYARKKRHKLDHDKTKFTFGNRVIVEEIPAGRTLFGKEIRYTIVTKF